MRPFSSEAGLRHLRTLAAAPRGAGSGAEAAARDHAMSELRTAGFEVRAESFAYSAFPGRWGTPIAGAIVGGTLVGSSALALHGDAGWPPFVFFAVGMVLATVFMVAMLGDAVLNVTLLRAIGTNVVATRGSAPRVWLMAHVDSKSQPIPTAVRMAGVALQMLAIWLAVAALVLTLLSFSPRMVWWATLMTAAAGTIPMMMSVVGNHSDGAVDNASGVAAVLLAAEQLAAESSVGVVITSAEELGLAGARAWSRRRAPGIALNCDGVDDGGALVAMYNGKSPMDVMRVLREESRGMIVEHRMPPGLLTDSTALADRGWRTVTVSHGSLATLRRVHTKRDSLANLRGDRIVLVADLLARSAEALSS